MNDIQLSPDDAELFAAIKATLKQNNIEFASPIHATLQKDVDGVSKIIQYLIDFPTVPLLIAALKYLPPVIVDYHKHRTSPLKLKVADKALEVPHGANLDDVVALIRKIENELSPKGIRSTSRSKKPKKRKGKT